MCTVHGPLHNVRYVRYIRYTMYGNGYREAGVWTYPWSKVAVCPPTALALPTMSHWWPLVVTDNAFRSMQS